MRMPERTRSSVLIATLLAVAVLAGMQPARADCYDVFGCSDRNYFRSGDLTSGPNCEFLWQMRNSIYKEHGYCFSTRRGISAFGNAGCQYDDINDVPLNRFERANAAAILQAERVLACPR